MDLDIVPIDHDITLDKLEVYAELLRISGKYRLKIADGDVRQCRSPSPVSDASRPRFSMNNFRV
ncbi:hypothetical protein [Rhizobium leguminosarum]|uniref:hypothetical protein n=1 Tax=Rhizobium leguminosarum TaxID=384 RepID=UPI0021BBC9A8|nr:hypothetical protein [Rhizobium leguminosarum]